MMNANANPFRSARVEQIRYALSDDSLEALAKVAIETRISAILGPKGTGKTTLLEDLQAPLLKRGFQIEHIRLNQDSSKEARSTVASQLSSMNHQTACLFDGAEVLSRWQWIRICKVASARGVSLIATLHKRRGVHVLIETVPDWPLAKSFVHQLAGTHICEDLINEAQTAFHKSKGNMREVFRCCYLYLAAVSSD